ncbi:MAG: hypothetical protein RBR28_11610 [Lentimicrobium sp.]|jgi:hypothetical protein|nr:hypothetical protein [Lentimicrobium sp.]
MDKTQAHFLPFLLFIFLTGLSTGASNQEFTDVANEHDSIQLVFKNRIVEAANDNIECRKAKKH